ncbi:hypothetical protein [uncultured Flavobacterium sp.]|uniref:hypothetical protein n=1 Tax=uncultured Flavobacterium sp. TaxID=165435 RepID=UPI0025D02A19|nr:hypothetical protein [uncultured Flavobacterium sp.]
MKPTDGSNPEKMEQKKLSIVEPDTIPLPLAADYTKAWRDSKDRPNVLAFTIPAKDLFELYESYGWHSVRGYLAIKPKDGSKEEHAAMLLVGVDEAGNDLVNPEKDQFVYDFTGPCPTLCDRSGSKLYDGEK